MSLPVVACSLPEFLLMIPGQMDDFEEFEKISTLSLDPCFRRDDIVKPGLKQGKRVGVKALRHSLKSLHRTSLLQATRVFKKRAGGGFFGWIGPKSLYLRG
jgi:hypothetical protein